MVDHRTIRMKYISLSRKVHLLFFFSQYPSVVEVFGFVFHFGGVICGPIFFFRDYMDFISGANYQCNDDNTVSVSSTRSH